MGTFTPEGTFDAVIARLGDLEELGVTAIELMPVAQFPGNRNWGYDGVHPYAVQDSYGGPEGLKRLVNACHGRGIAVALDVVYNHLGPEGNYLGEFGPYFTDRYRTPWGRAINFDGAWCDEVRSYVIENALHWIGTYHIDALRIDAIHGIFDFGARHILAGLGEAVHAAGRALGRIVHVVPESDLNDARVIRPPEIGGHGLDAQWNDDFHHAVHTIITGECRGYYADFGSPGQLEKALREGFVYSGQYSLFRKRSHGNSSADRPPTQFVVFSQNHDQVGNRMRGERLSSLASFEALKLAAGAVILSPNIPLLFMGEEYGEDAPFLYFVSHGDPGLVEAVRRGRAEEFRAFDWEGEPPDPQSPETFRRSHLDWTKRDRGRHGTLLRFYRALIRLRKESPALAGQESGRPAVRRIGESGVVTLLRRDDHGRAFVLFNFEKSRVDVPLFLPGGGWKRVLDSADREWNGPGSTAPEVLRDGEHLTLRPESVVILAGEEGGA